MAEALRNGLALYRERLNAAREGRICDHDRARETERKVGQVAQVSKHDRGGWLFAACTIAAYVLIVGLAFAVHPLAGLLFLWLALYVAPITATLALALLPFALAAGVIFTGLVLLFIYWP